MCVWRCSTNCCRRFCCANRRAEASACGFLNLLAGLNHFDCADGAALERSVAVPGEDELPPTTDNPSAMPPIQRKLFLISDFSRLHANKDSVSRADFMSQACPKCGYGSRYSSHDQHAKRFNVDDPTGCRIHQRSSTEDESRGINTLQLPTPHGFRQYAAYCMKTGSVGKKALVDA